MSTSIGALFASLTLESSQFIQGTQQAAQAANTMSSSVGHSFSEMSKRATEFFGIYKLDEFFLEQVKGAFEFAASLQTVSRELGLTTTQYQALNVAAIESGVKMDQLTTGLKKLQAEFGQAQLGSEKWKKAFEGIGITPEALKNAHGYADLLPQIADGLTKSGNSAKTAGEAQILLGKSYAATLPVLDKLAEGWDVMTIKAEDAGMLTSDQAAKAKQAADDIDLLSYSLKVRLAESMSDVLPLIKDITDALGDMIKNTSREIQVLSELPIRAKLAFDKARESKIGSVLMGQGWDNSDAAKAVQQDRADLFLQDSPSVRISDILHPDQFDAGGGDNMDLSSPKHARKKRSGENQAAKEIKKLQDESIDNTTLLGIEPTDLAAMRDYNVQKALFNNLQAAGQKVSAAQRTEIERLTTAIVDQKAQLKVKDGIDALQAEDDQLHMTNQQKAIYNDFTKAGIPLTLDQTKALAGTNDQTKLLGSLAAAAHVPLSQLIELLSHGKQTALDNEVGNLNADIETLIKNSKEANTTLGMNQWDSQIHGLVSRYNEGHPGANVDPNSITVTGSSNPELQALSSGIATINQSRSANAQQAIKDYERETQLLQMTSKEQDVMNELKKYGLTLDSEDGKFLADKVRQYDAMKEKMQAIQGIASDFSNAIGNALTGLLEGTQTWGQTFKNLLTDISHKMIEDLVIKPMEKLVESGLEKLLMNIVGNIGGGNAAWNFGASGGYDAVNANVVGMALGGDTPAGAPRWVGEKGPELFVPQQNGTIVPNYKVGGDSGPVFNIDARGSSNPAETAALVQQGIMAALPMIRQDATAFTLRKLARPNL